MTLPPPKKCPETLLHKPDHPFYQILAVHTFDEAHRLVVKTAPAPPLAQPPPSCVPRPVVASPGPSIQGCEAMGRYHMTLVQLINWYNQSPRERLQPLMQLAAMRRKGRSCDGRPRPVSRRLLDFVGRTLLRQVAEAGGDHALSDIHADYKRNIDRFHRRMFDPFCRSDKLSLEVVRVEDPPPSSFRGQPVVFSQSDANCAAEAPEAAASKEKKSSMIVTNVAQMNFVRWALETQLITKDNRLSDQIEGCLAQLRLERRKARPGKKTANLQNPAQDGSLVESTPPVAPEEQSSGVRA